MNQERDTLLAEAMESTPESPTINGKTLRPITLGSLLRLQRIGNILGDLGNFDEKDPKFLEAVAEMMWLHAEEEEKITAVIDSASARRAAVEIFSSTISLSEFTEITREIGTGFGRVRGSMASPIGEDNNIPKEISPTGR